MTLLKGQSGKKSNLTFDFDQRIGLSLLGKVGTRVQVNANFDTQSTFDFQNLLKLEFEPTEDDKNFIRELQKDMEIIDEPFVKAANNLGITEDELFEKMKHYESIGVLRRFAAILRHRQVGFTANGMIVWKVPEDRISSVGETLGSFPQVSHCYERPTYDDWPYNVFSMIHCKTHDEANDVAKTIQDQIHVDEFRILFSSREFKKTRVEYFVENSFSLEDVVTS